ncbi:MAG: type II toxin-antitoxin system VapC family toxin [Hyphomicrobiaceae bacterium]|nr:type II toxin-antitoxin system VapC family toxin [Hyphomicrobiaceae bacterium]
MVAIIDAEPDYFRAADILAWYERRETSTIALFETFAAMLRKCGDSTLAEERLREFIHEYDIQVVPLDDFIGQVARTAFVRFGKGRNSKAALNMGDCFAYAASSRLEIDLLYIGEDFPNTDVRTADLPEFLRSKPNDS